MVVDLHAVYLRLLYTEVAQSLYGVNKKFGVARGRLEYPVVGGTDRPTGEKASDGYWCEEGTAGLADLGGVRGISSQVNSHRKMIGLWTDKSRARLGL
jgi:hypothetical protein